MVVQFCPDELPDTGQGVSGQPSGSPSQLITRRSFAPDSDAKIN